MISKLATYMKPSPNCNKRVGKVKKIAIHHAATVNASLEGIGNVFAQPTRRASSNYAIDCNGNIACYVEENYRAWTTGNDVDEDAITIEVANSKGSPNWEVSDKALAALIDLCVDICERYDIEKLIFSDKYNGNVVIHKWYQATVCPGPYLESKIPYVVAEVNKRLEKPVIEASGLYRVQVGAFRNKENAENLMKKLKADGYEAFIKFGD